MKRAPSSWLLISAAAVALMVGTNPRVLAQIEGDDRGVKPVNSSGDFVATDIVVDTTGKSAEEARQNGWQQAQRLGWSKLYANTHGGRGASLPDSRLNGLVSSIEVVQEQIGPRRYKAKLNIYFDRARAGQILGVGGRVVRSAPLLVLPIEVSGGADIVFEQQTEWQKAWARFRTADSIIDYVRPTGSGAESLLVNAGQAERRNRQWWRAILDQFGAADVIIPVVMLERKYPGGPVVGRFAARQGADNRLIGTFDLKVSSEEGVAEMLDEGVKRMDALFIRALNSGMLRPDASLIVSEPVDPEEIKTTEPEDDDSARREREERERREREQREKKDQKEDDSKEVTTPTTPTVQGFVIQYDTPDAQSIGSVEGAVRGIPGVSSASTTNFNLGGTSSMRVTFAGDGAALRAALQSRGFTVSGGGGTLRIRR